MDKDTKNELAAVLNSLLLNYEALKAIGRRLDSTSVPKSTMSMTTAIPDKPKAEDNKVLTCSTCGKQYRESDNTYKMISDIDLGPTYREIKTPQGARLYTAHNMACFEKVSNRYSMLKSDVAPSSQGTITH